MELDEKRLEQLAKFTSTAHKISEDEAKNRIEKMGPKRQYRFELTGNNGWRAGFTKETLAKRTERRRRREKERRRMRAKQRARE